ncbi:ubiquitin-conjugating enzyme E2s, partial [Gamsiella multidivaricata]|uniref:ubiquitin-conjugating enzyme E2s n=1 Tax=Gamsiella multidivaricata TaxID=101098 RepID=UPI00221E3F5C
MESISPIALRKVTRELYALENDPPEGIRLILNEDAMTDIQAWIQGPEGTPYEGGCFRLRIQLGTDFPNSAPKCFFLTKIFHPNVSNKGDVCVSTLKKDWKKDLGIRHILLVVKCLLIVPNPESALNEEAGRQLLERYDDYAKHARLMTSIHAQP